MRATFLGGRRPRASQPASVVLPDLSGAGHPSDALGSNGQRYNRTDRAGWVYEKAAGVWTLVDVPGDGAVPNMLGTPRFYLSPYVPFAQQRGNLQTNGRSSSVQQRLQIIESYAPSTGQGSSSGPWGVSGFDGSPNLARVASPSGNGRRAVSMQIQEADAVTSGSADTGSTHVRRTMVRWQADNQSPSMLLSLRTTFAFAFAMRIPAAMKAAYQYSGSAEHVVYQIHDNGQGTGLSPNVGLYMIGSNSGPTGLGAASGSPRLAMRVCGSPATVSIANGHPSIVITNVFSLNDFPADTWLYFLLRLRLGYQASDAPRTEVWYAAGNGAVSKIGDTTAINTYNSDALGGGPYATIGDYKYRFPGASGWGASSKRTTYFGDCVQSADGHSMNSDDIEDVFNYLRLR